MFDDVHIVIPSSGRARMSNGSTSGQITLEQLPSTVYPYTWLAVPDDEVKEYYRAVTANYKNVGLIKVPNSCDTITKTREYIFKNCQSKYLMMLDDDMRFCYRMNGMSDPRLKLLPPKHIEIVRMLLFWRKLMDDYVHCGPSPRGNNNRVFDEIQTCKRMCNAYMYDMDVIRKLKPPPYVDCVPIMEDFDLTLRLIKAGYPNALFYRWCWNQYGGSNAPGGCSQYRDGAMQARAAHMLAERHPGLVKIVEKRQEIWKQGMEVRTDVTIYWQKAYGEHKFLHPERNHHE